MTTVAETQTKTGELIIPEEIHRALSRHISFLPPEKTGRTELIKAMGEPLLGLSQVNISRSQPPLEVTDFRAESGKSYAVIGANGSGKSTLLDGLTERDTHLETEQGQGAIVIGNPVHNRDLLCVARLDQEELLGEVGTFTAGEVLQFSADYFKTQFPVDWDKLNGDMDAYERILFNQDAHNRIDDLMGQFSEFLEMEPFLNIPVADLSGGERTKLSLFMILLSEPDVILLDEPTNHLDLKSIYKIVELFKRYKEAGSALVNVSHVDWFLEEVGTDGTIEVAHAKGRRTVISSKSPYTSYVQDAGRENQGIFKGDIDWGQREYDRKHALTLFDIPPYFTVPDSPLVETTLPSALYGGERVIVLGDNGVGKTVLLNTLYENGDNSLPKKNEGVNCAYLPQFWPEEIAGSSIGTFFDWIKSSSSPLSEGSSINPKADPKKLFIARAKEAAFGGIRTIGDSWLNQPLNKLSGGEQRLLWFLAVSCLRDIDVLLLDEPTNHMDKSSQNVIARAIDAFSGAVVVASHDPKLITRLSHVEEGDHRTIKTWHMQKEAGVTRIDELAEDTQNYLTRLREEARRAAARLRL